jgi:hypothetical protein
MGINALSNIGAQQQALAQDQLDAQYQNQMNPITEQQLLLAAAQGIPVGSLVGQSGTQNLYRNRGAGLLGGALAGAELGSAIPVLGTGLGAIAGGLLGAFG